MSSIKQEKTILCASALYTPFSNTLSVTQSVHKNNEHAAVDTIIFVGKESVPVGFKEVTSSIKQLKRDSAYSLADLRVEDYVRLKPCRIREESKNIEDGNKHSSNTKAAFIVARELSIIEQCRLTGITSKKVISKWFKADCYKTFVTLTVGQRCSMSEFKQMLNEFHKNLAKAFPKKYAGFSDLYTCNIERHLDGGFHAHIYFMCPYLAHNNSVVDAILSQCWTFGHFHIGSNFSHNNKGFSLLRSINYMIKPDKVMVDGEKVEMTKNGIQCVITPRIRDGIRLCTHRFKLPMCSTTNKNLITLCRKFVGDTNEFKLTELNKVRNSFTAFFSSIRDYTSNYMSNRFNNIRVTAFGQMARKLVKLKTIRAMLSTMVNTALSDCNAETCHYRNSLDNSRNSLDNRTTNTYRNRTTNTYRNSLDNINQGTNNQHNTVNILDSQLIDISAN